MNVIRVIVPVFRKHNEGLILNVSSVGVRFLPTGCVAPFHVAHDLSDWQRRILQAIAGGKEPRLQISAHKSIHLWLTVRCATICFI
jgi:hypothetical protein